MAMIRAETAQGFSGLPVLKQLGFFVVLAASIALGVAAILYTQEPSYSLLYGNLAGTDKSMVLDTLEKSSIDYKIDESSGAVMVASDKLHQARLKLASEGLPKGGGIGFELFGQEQDLGTSKFIEKARYQHAIEIELARSIKTLRNVRNARIHLAIPKRSVFVRKKEKPTASVVLDLYAGRSLGDEQVASIVHMVSSSVPSLMPENVTVVDQSGRLLSRVTQDSMMSATNSQFEFTRKLEDTYKQRIEELLSPIVGPGRVRAQVVADIDFTMTEKTRESYNPDLPALRSEQLIQESSGGGNGVSGVPGALSNQPPAGGTTEPANGATAESAPAASGRSNSRTTRNYELDKTISHTRSSVGSIRRLSVAVLVDDLEKAGADGKTTRTPLNDAAIARITSLVKEAVGFNTTRGDRVNVINASFYTPEAPAELPEQGIMEQPWMQNIIKQGIGFLIAIVLIFGVIRPVFRNLTARGEADQRMAESAGQQGNELEEDQLQLTQAGQQQAQLPPPEVDNQLTAAKSMVTQDPARVAQVVKTWVASDG